MPIYVFQCPICGHQREVIQSYSAPAPVCDHSLAEPASSSIVITMERQISASLFQVKGFNSATGYASPRTFVNSKNGITTIVKGHPEAFADGLRATSVKETR